MLHGSAKKGPSSKASGATSASKPVSYAQSFKSKHSKASSKVPNDYQMIGGTQYHLVPCRWESTGWKYVEVDPAKHSYFQNPNRMNAHGFSPLRAQKARNHFLSPVPQGSKHDKS